MEWNKEWDEHEDQEDNQKKIRVINTESSSIIPIPSATQTMQPNPPIPSKPTLQPNEPQPAQRENWSFWSSVSAITSQIKHAAEDTIDIAYQQLDPEYNKINENNKPLPEQQGTNTPSPKFETKDIMKATENVLNVVDKGFDYASDFIGNTLYKGFETGKQLSSSLTSPPSKSPPQQQQPPALKQPTATTSPIKSISTKLMDVSINTLEELGKNVYEIAPKRHQPSMKKSLEFIDMDTYFHDITGKAHIDTLGILAMNKTSELNWDVDELIEDALDEDEINQQVFVNVKTLVPNSKSLQQPNFEGIQKNEDYLMFLCQQSGIYNSC